MQFVPILDPIPARKRGSAANPEIATAIRAQLIGDDQATALGIEARSAAPVLDLCRKLVAAGHDPTSTLHAYRGATLSLVVRAIGEAADLEVNSKGTRFVRRASRIAPTGAAASAPRPDASDVPWPSLRTARRSRR
jgi:hypothetical protein